LDLELIYGCTYEYAIAWIPFMLAGNLCYHVGVVKPCAMVTDYKFGVWLDVYSTLWAPAAQR
jgi:hypothetical protein